MRIHPGSATTITPSTEQGKGKLLDEFTRVAGPHRKAAIRLLRRDKRPPSGRKRVALVA